MKSNKKIKAMLWDIQKKRAQVAFSKIAIKTEFFVNKKNKEDSK